uniref:Polyprotein n=1 Tax=Crocidura lasiura picornavirus 3 TaxID=3139482 RepID=A0AB38ZJT9_9VIRU
MGRMAMERSLSHLSLPPSKERSWREKNHL